MRKWLMNKEVQFLSMHYLRDLYYFCAETTDDDAFDTHTQLSGFSYASSHNKERAPLIG